MRDYLEEIKMTAVGLVGPVALGLLCWTLRMEEISETRSLDKVLRQRPFGNVIFAFWHSTQLVLGYKGRGQGIHVLISQHRDGEYIARVMRSMGNDVIRGSSSRGGIKAMASMVRAGKRGHFLAVTPDGPRGPREKAQPGIIFLAKKTGQPIMPVGMGYSNCWRLPSWDKFRIPKPFSRVVLCIGELIRVPPDLSDEELESYRDELEKTLNRLTTEAETEVEAQAQA